MRQKQPATLAKMASAAATASLTGMSNHWRPGSGQAKNEGVAAAVVASENLPSAGGTVTAVAHNALITVTVASGTFPEGALIELSDHDISEVDGGLVGIGLQVLVDGQPVAGGMDRALTVAIDDPAIRPGGTVEVWDGQTFSQHDADISTGRAVITLRGASDLVLVLDEISPRRTGLGRPGRNRTLI